MPVHTACIHKRHSVGLPTFGTLRCWVISPNSTTCNKNGLTRTGAWLRTLSNCAVGGLFFPVNEVNEYE